MRRRRTMIVSREENKISLFPELNESGVNNETRNALGDFLKMSLQSGRSLSFVMMLPELETIAMLTKLFCLELRITGIL
jgi:hypothetical protein